MKIFILAFAFVVVTGISFEEIDFKDYDYDYHNDDHSDCSQNNEVVDMDLARALHKECIYKVGLLFYVLERSREF